MELYNVKPIRISWQGGYGDAFIIRIFHNEYLHNDYLIVFVDGKMIVENLREVQEREYLEFDEKFFFYPNDFCLIEFEYLRFCFKVVYLSNSKLTADIDLFLPDKCEITRIPFHRVDINEDFRKRVFVSNIPEYVCLYDRQKDRVFIQKPQKKGSFRYVDSWKKVRTGDLYLCLNDFMPKKMWFRHFPEIEGVYAVEIFPRFWRIKLNENENVYHIYVSDEEVITMIREKKLQTLF